MCPEADGLYFRGALPFSIAFLAATSAATMSPAIEEISVLIRAFGYVLETDHPECATTFLFLAAFLMLSRIVFRRSLHGLLSSDLAAALIMSNRSGRLMVLKKTSEATDVSILSNNPNSMHSENSRDEYRSIVFTNIANNHARLFVIRGELDKSFGSFLSGCGTGRFLRNRVLSEPNAPLCPWPRSGVVSER